MSAFIQKPIAPDKEGFLILLETIPDAMLLSDREGRIALVNNNAENLFGYNREELLGKKVEIVIPVRLRSLHCDRRAAYYADPKVRSMGQGLDLWGRRKDGTEFPVDISLSPVHMGGKTFIWSAVRDISERVRLIAQLRMALDDVRMLSGLLPICASCKKIRDERGCWQQLESYIQSHSEAKFSHGLCEECVRKLYKPVKS
jgi:PAS domain S-box-containing protein